MSTNSDRDGARGMLATVGVLLLPVLCCGLPLVIAAGALGAVGSVLGNPWVIGTAVTLVLGLLVWRVRRHTAASAGGSTPDGCCPPGPCHAGPTSPRATSRSGEHAPAPASTPRPAASRPSRRVLYVALAVVAVLGLATVAYSALSPSGGSSASSSAPGNTSGAAADDRDQVPGAFTARTVDGDTVTVPGAQPSVLLFFSVECGGCGPTAQALGEVQDATSEKANFVIVDVASYETAEDIEGFLAANEATGLAYTIDTDARLIGAYQVTQLSTVVVLDTAGAVVFRAIEPTAEQIDAELAKVSPR